MTRQTIDDYKYYIGFSARVKKIFFSRSAADFFSRVSHQKVTNVNKS